MEALSGDPCSIYAFADLGIGVLTLLPPLLCRSFERRELLQPEGNHLLGFLFLFSGRSSAQPHRFPEQGWSRGRHHCGSGNVHFLGRQCRRG